MTYPIFPKHKIGTTFRTQWGFFIITKRPLFGSIYEGQCVFTDERIGHSAPQTWGIIEDNNAWLCWALHEGNMDRIDKDFPLVVKSDKEIAAINELLHVGVIKQI